MNQINYLSDIKILENYPKTDNFVYHYTTDGSNTCYDVSLEIGNCRKDGDYLVICLDNHQLKEGQLKVRREFHFKDDDFLDKEWTKVVEHRYDIYLSEDVDCENDIYVLPQYMPIFKGDKGDAYIITEDDYEEIATLTLSKIDWDEVLKNKQDKLVSGENIKTLNGESLLGKGNIKITISDSIKEGTKKTFGELNSYNTYSAKVNVTNGRGALITISYNHNGVGRSLEPKLVWYPKNDGSTPWYQPVAKAWIDPNRGNNPPEYLPYLYGQRTPVLSGNGDIKIWVDFKDEPETYLDLDMVCWVNLEASEANLPFDDPNRTMGAPMRVDVPKQLVVFKEDEFNFDCLNNEEREDTFSFYMNGGNLINTLTFLNGYNKPFVLIKDASGAYTTQISRYTVGGSGKQEVTFDVKLDATTSNRNCELNLTTQGQTYKVPTNQKIVKLLLGGKVDDVKVDGTSVVTDKVANISLTSYQQSKYKANVINVFNKTTDTFYPSTRAVADYVDPVKAKVENLQLFKYPNATIFGTLRIENGQVSKFSSTNYLQFPFVVDLRNKPFTLEFSYVLLENTAEQQNIFDSEFGLALALRGTKLVLAVSSDGATWDSEYSANVPIVMEVTNYVRITGNGVGNFEVYISADKQQWIKVIETRPHINAPYPKTITIGKSVDGQYPLNGIINLNDANLTVLNNVVWTGMDDAGLSTRLATNLNNIDAEGEQKIKDIAKDTSNEYDLLYNTLKLQADEETAKVNKYTTVGEKTLMLPTHITNYNLGQTVSIPIIGDFEASDIKVASRYPLVNFSIVGTAGHIAVSFLFNRANSFYTYLNSNPSVKSNVCMVNPSNAPTKAPKNSFKVSNDDELTKILAISKDYGLTEPVITFTLDVDGHLVNTNSFAKIINEAHGTFTTFEEFIIANEQYDVAKSVFLLVEYLGKSEKLIIK